MKLSDLKIGDEIKWDQIVGISDIYTSFGPIIKITETAIIVQGKRFPEVILISDLRSGLAKILGLRVAEKKEEDKSMIISRKPDKETLEALFKECNHVILRAAKLLSERTGIKTTDVTLRSWLIKDGIIEPTQKRKSPIKSETRKAATINKEFEDAFPKPNRAEAELQNNATKGAIKDNTAADFTPEDEEPIPYKIGFLPDNFKIELLNTIREAAYLREAPAAVTLAFIYAILDAELPEVG